MISEISKTNNLEAQNLLTELWNLDGAIYEYTDHNSDLESFIEYEFDLKSDCLQMKFAHERCFSPSLTNFSSSEYYALAKRILQGFMLWFSRTQNICLSFESH